MAATAFMNGLYLFNVTVLLCHCHVRADFTNVSFAIGGTNVHIVRHKNVILELKMRNGSSREIHIGRDITLLGEPSWKFNYVQLYGVWPNGVQLKISVVSIRPRRMRVHWILLYGVNQTLLECFDMNPYHWFGGGEMMSQQWPIQTDLFDKIAYIPGYRNSRLVDPYFLSSAGISLRVKKEVPLFVSIEGLTLKKLCFHAEFKPPYRNTDLRALKLMYTISYSEDFNLKKLWLSDSAGQFHHPKTSASFKAIEYPVWSTWVHKNDIDQTILLSYAKQLHKNNLSGSYIEIRNPWESCPGDATFDSLRFPNLTSAICYINELGFEVALHIHPFVSTECRRVYDEGDEEKYFVNVDGFRYTGNTTWLKDGPSAIVDFTNKYAVAWWTKRVKRLIQMGISSFKCDGNSVSFLPTDAYLNVAEKWQPGCYSTAYAKACSMMTGAYVNGVGYFSHKFGGSFIAIEDRYSAESMEADLRSIIITYLNSGIVGYPYISPGCVYGPQFDREFYIRYLQLTTFLPIMYICVPPWIYDDEVTKITREMIELHSSISLTIKGAMMESLKDGSPVIRPLWWIDWSDTTAQTIADEFLVGSRYLVAPILKRKAVQRNVYLPKGIWIDFLRGNELHGPIWLNNYSISLNEIAYFQLKS